MKFCQMLKVFIKPKGSSMVLKNLLKHLLKEFSMVVLWSCIAASKFALPLNSSAIKFGLGHS